MMYPRRLCAKVIRQTMLDVISRDDNSEDAADWLLSPDRCGFWFDGAGLDYDKARPVLVRFIQNPPRRLTVKAMVEA